MATQKGRGSGKTAKKTARKATKKAAKKTVRKAVKKTARNPAKKAARKPVKRTPKKTAGKARRISRPSKEAAAEFGRGVTLVAVDRLLDAIEAFRRAIRIEPDGSLADDALYNIGLCYFQMGLYEKAARVFRKVIRDYPDGTIHEGPLVRERGKTAAKAHFSLMNCHLLMGDTRRAKRHLKALDDHPESHVLVGDKVTRRVKYRDLAAEVFERMLAHEG